MTLDYDILVIGGGHAGCEAASAAARMGSRTLLLTMNMTKLANMSCNPAVGGVAKGQIVREIDALGGRTARITDRTTLQFRMLNRSKIRRTSISGRIRPQNCSSTRQGSVPA